MKIGVIGAGIIGLTTALELQDEYRNAEITVVAKDFFEDTTSYVAAGIFRPGTSFAGPSEEITKKWIYDAFQAYDAIRKTEDAPLAGISQISGYIFSSTLPSITRNHLIEDIVPIYRRVTEEELKICPGEWKYGSFFKTLVIDSTAYMPYAANKFKAAGGKIMAHKIETLNELQGKFDVIVNSTGLGAKSLCEDYKLVPIRGQVLKVAAPWLKMAFYADYDTYIVPGMNGQATLGGCRNYDSYSTEPNKYDYESIKTRCEALVPSLKHAKVTAVKVGLRPHRSPVRVEIEFKETPSGILRIVHNYGHGGYGVTTAPGTAKYACRLVRDVITGYSKL